MTAIAVLGAGTVGRTLAAGWARAGHDVVLGSRTPDTDRLRAAVAETGARRAATHAVAARAADLVVVTVPGDQVEALVGDLGAALRGRPVIDTTNVLTPHAPVLHHLDVLVGGGSGGVQGVAQHRLGADGPTDVRRAAQRHALRRSGRSGPGRGRRPRSPTSGSGRYGWARAPMPSRSPTRWPACGSNWCSPAAGTAGSACGCSPTSTTPRPTSADQHLPTPHPTRKESCDPQRPQPRQPGQAQARGDRHLQPRGLDLDRLARRLLVVGADPPALRLHRGRLAGRHLLTPTAATARGTP